MVNTSRWAFIHDLTLVYQKDSFKSKISRYTPTFQTPSVLQFEIGVVWDFFPCLAGKKQTVVYLTQHVSKVGEQRLSNFWYISHQSIEGEAEGRNKEKKQSLTEKEQTLWGNQP